jgi:hypothetical protein
MSENAQTRLLKAASEYAELLFEQVARTSGRQNWISVNVLSHREGVLMRFGNAWFAP